MPQVTFNDIAANSFAILNVFMPGESLPAADANFALGVANRMLSGWSQRNRFVPLIARERFDLTANKGSPTNPYTIGDGGNFDTERPSNQRSIVSANLILTATSPEVRVPLGIYTDQAYDANKIPAMSNTQPTGLYYNPTYASGLGSIFLWPVPDNATNDIELFLQKAIAQFANGTTAYDLPDGAEDAITYQLAKRMQGTYGRQMSAADMQIAVETLGTFTRSNENLVDQASDAYLFNAGRQTLYNINSGSGG